MKTLIHRKRYKYNSVCSSHTEADTNILPNLRLCGCGFLVGGCWLLLLRRAASVAHGFAAGNNNNNTAPVVIVIMWLDVVGRCDDDMVQVQADKRQAHARQDMHEKYICIESMAQGTRAQNETIILSSPITMPDQVSINPIHDALSMFCLHMCN